jgi:signal transduction histidine kinase
MARPVVLHVDENPKRRSERTRILHEAGYQPIEAATASEALAQALDSAPDLIVTRDVRPGISRQLRANTLTAGIPVIEIVPSGRKRRRGHFLDVHLPAAAEKAALSTVIEALLRAKSAGEHNASLQELMQANSQLALSNQDFQRFAAVVAHDFLSPVATISSLASAMVEEYGPSLSESARDHLALLQKTSGHMSALVHGVFEYSRIGSHSAPLSWFECDEILAGIVSSAHTLFPDAVTEITAEPLPRVFGDRELLAQVFQNLIFNAIRYRRPAVPARVYVSAVSGESDWTFSVDDNGLGVEPNAREHLFDLFQHVSRHKNDGVGLGLPIAKKIVELHGGRIWVEPAPDQGSRFLFTIPVPANQSQTPAAARRPARTLATKAHKAG